MKSFAQYIQSLTEDIELTTDVARNQRVNIRFASDKFEYEKSKTNLGKIHPDYSLYRGHGEIPDFYIVQDKTNKVVGHISTYRVDGKASKHFGINHTYIDINHTYQKIGYSLAVAAYKQLSKLGYTITSGDRQSVGGASIWRRLMKDKSVSKDVRAMRGKKDMGQASKLPTSDIWTTSGRLGDDDSKTRAAGKAKGIVMHDPDTPKGKAAGKAARLTSLVLRGKKPNKKAAP